MTVSLALEGVSFAYPDGTRALEGIDLRIEPGERVVLIGQNGSGKSTLVRHLNGLLRPTTGRVLVDGADASDRHVADLARSVGLVFQNPDRQIFAASVGREVAFGLRNIGLRGRELDARVERALEAVGLTGEAGTNPYDLGYSRRKSLALASILAMETPAVVLDEPTTGQDAPGVARTKAVIADLSAGGRTVIAVSHDMRFAAETFLRVIVMAAGRIVLDGTPAEVFAEAAWPTLAETYLEPPFAARIGARMGLGPTPTEAAFVEAMAMQQR